MKIKRSILAAVALACLGTAALGQQALFSALNRQTQNGWFVGGVMEILGTATFRIDNGVKAATAVAGAATLNKLSGTVTSEALTTAGGASYTLTITDTSILATDQVFASVALGTATTGMPVVTTVKPGAGTLTIVVRNATGAAALNGTIAVTFAALRT